MINQNFGILAAVVALLGAASYAWYTLKGKAEPNRVSWVLWTVTPIITFAAEMAQHVHLAIGLFTLAEAVGPFFIVIATFLNPKAFWRVSQTDVWCGVLAVLALILWLITGQSNVAIVFSIVASVFSAIPTVTKSYSYPTSESPWAYVASFAGAIITLLTIRHWTLATYGFPLYLMIEGAIIGLFILVPRRARTLASEVPGIPVQLLGVPKFDPNPLTVGTLSSLSIPFPDARPGIAAGEYFVGPIEPGIGKGMPMTLGNGKLFASLGANLPVGTYAVHVRVKDTANQWSNITTANLTVNPLHPAAPAGLVVPSPAQVPVLTWKAVPRADSYNIYRDSKSAGTTRAATYSDADAVDGLHKYCVTAVNTGGESPPSDLQVVLVDHTPPKITYSLSARPNHAGWHNAPVTITFAASDSKVGIASCSLPVELRRDGANQLVTGSAINVTGNVSRISAAISIDQTPPTVGRLAWSQNPVAAGATTLLTVPVVDHLSGVLGGEYIGSVDPGQGNGMPMALDVQAGSLSVPFTANVPPGAYPINVRAKDAAGNWSDLESTVLIVSPNAMPPLPKIS